MENNKGFNDFFWFRNHYSCSFNTHISLFFYLLSVNTTTDKKSYHIYSIKRGLLVWCSHKLFQSYCSFHNFGILVFSRKHLSQFCLYYFKIYYQSPTKTIVFVCIWLFLWNFVYCFLNEGYRWSSNPSKLHSF